MKPDQFTTFVTELSTLTQNQQLQFLTWMKENPEMHRIIFNLFEQAFSRTPSPSASQQQALAHELSTIQETIKIAMPGSLTKLMKPHLAGVHGPSVLGQGQYRQGGGAAPIGPIV